MLNVLSHYPFVLISKGEIMHVFLFRSDTWEGLYRYHMHRNFILFWVVFLFYPQ